MVKEYNIIAYSWIRNGVATFEFDVHDGDATSFLKSMEEYSEEYIVHVVTPITKDEYETILEKMK